MNRFDGITPQGWEPDSQTIVSLILPDNLSKLVTQAEAMLSHSTDTKVQWRSSAS